MNYICKNDIKYNYYDVKKFFFFKQKTAYEMRISDWSSDVCSSDLMEPWHEESVENSSGASDIPLSQGCGLRRLPTAPGATPAPRPRTSRTRCRPPRSGRVVRCAQERRQVCGVGGDGLGRRGDRKSTRLNSSH